MGVLLGGLLTSSLSWHWIFLVNLPIGVAVYVLCLRLLPDTQGQAVGEKLDVAGAVTITTALMLAVYAIVNGNEQGWLSQQTLLLLGAAAALLGVFLALQARVEHPLMPLGFVSQPQCVGCQCSGGAVGGSHVCMVFYLCALHAAGAGLLAHAGGFGVFAIQFDHGCLFAGIVR